MVTLVNKQRYAFGRRSTRTVWNTYCAYFGFLQSVSLIISNLYASWMYDLTQASHMWKYFCTALLLLLFGFALRFLPISLQEKLRDWFLIILFGDSLEEFTVISVPLPEIFETPPSSSFFVSQQFPAVLSFCVGPWTCSFNSGRFAFSVGSIIGATYYTVQAFGTQYARVMNTYNRVRTLLPW